VIAQEQAAPPGQATAPHHTVPPTGAAQPQSPLADQAKPAAVGPAQAATTGSVPQEVPGATRQTMPSTVSAENAAQDKLPIAAFQFPLTEEQKQKIAASLSNASVAPVGDVKAKVSDALPNGVLAQRFPDEVTAQIPEAAKYKYVNLADRVLIVDPPNGTVVGEIKK
jgi:hypothetical protein